jgi:hypothetical protein
MYDASEVLNMTADDLDLIIGESLLEKYMGAKPASNSEKIAVAGRWFESNLNRFHNAVCPNPVVQKYLLGKDNETRNELFAAVVDALLTLGGVGTIPIAVLSARLIHYGLDQLCSTNE